MINRKNILVYTTDFQGSGHYRIQNPAHILKESRFANVVIKSSPLSDIDYYSLFPDAIVWQMQFDPNIKEVIKNYKKLNTRLVNIYEMDDWPFELDENNPHLVKNVKDLKSRYQSILSNMDVVVVTTPELANKVHSTFHFKYDRIHILPNYISIEYSWFPPLEKKHTKPRIGWAGGISHKIDLDLLTKAVEETYDKYDWFFFGHIPDGIDREKVTHVHGRSYPEYMKALHEANLDLALAPLANIPFNQYKSNIKLIEYGILDIPILASPVGPYREMDVNYVENNTIEGWYEALKDITSYIENTDLRNKHKEEILKNYILEEHARDVADAWSISPVSEPQNIVVDESTISVVGESSLPYDSYKSFEEAIQARPDRDILYVRPGTFITEEMVSRIRKAAKDFPQMWTFSVLSNDSDSYSFPIRRERNNVPIETALLIDEVVKNKDKYFPIPYPIGPVVYIRASAFQVLGLPNKKLGDEINMADWSAINMVTRNFLLGNLYTVTFGNPPYDQKQLTYAASSLKVRYPEFSQSLNHLTIEEELKEYFRQIELEFHHNNYRYMEASSDWSFDDWVRAFNYADNPHNYEFEDSLKFLVVVDDKSKYNISHPNVTVADNPTMEDILKNDYLIRLDKGDTIAKGAFAILNHALRNNQVNVCYSDHDYMDENGSHVNPFFKPGFDYEMLLSQNYMDGLTAFKVSELVKYYHVADWSEDPWLFNWRMALNLKESVLHIPHLLVTKTRSIASFTKHLIQTASKNIVEHLNRVGITAAVIQHPRNPLWFQIRYLMQKDRFPKVSIIIPTKDRLDLIKRTMDTLLDKTAYPNYEVIIVDNDSTDMMTLNYLRSIKDSRVKIVRYAKPFNWSELNNFGVTRATGEYYLFLNNDVEILMSSWLHDMVATFQHSDVGVVGARLLNGNGTIQHCGVSVWRGMAGHDFKNVQENFIDTFGRTQVSREASAVTGACLLTSANLFHSIGGFNTEFEVSYNDVAYCLEAMKRGYRNIVCMSAVLFHFESSTRGAVTKNIRSLSKMVEEGKLLGKMYDYVDKYFNPNFKEGDVLCKQLNSPPCSPYFISTPEQRVAYINAAREDVFSGSRLSIIPYVLEMSGTSIRFVSPKFPNVSTYDLSVKNEFDEFLDCLERLDIKSTALCQLYPGNIQMLRTLEYLELPHVYFKKTFEHQCPQIYMKTEKRTCETLPSVKECQKCVDESCSPFGYVSVKNWRDEWKQYLMSDF